jgi:Dyp-type peroxidase family
MAGASVTRTEPDYRDVQGLVRYGYGKMTEASFVLLRVRDLNAARSWLRAAPVTNAVELAKPPRTALQIAFTATGLDALNVHKSVIAGFSPEFLTGMTEESRSRRLGDVGANAPSQWAWGNATSTPQVMVMFFAEAGALEAFKRSITAPAWNEAFEELRWLGTADFDGVEPFGFTDGISQPEIDWKQSRDSNGPQIEFSNVASLGEFLLGYRNEYDKYTNRPLVDADAASGELLPAEDAPEKKDVGRNGTYLVMRQLRQDVRSFWQFVHRQANGDAALADRLAAAFVGRTQAGDPLVPLSQEKIPGIGQKQAPKNQFTFEEDPTGARCPFGAHVRRANPRTSDYAGRTNGFGRLVAALGFGPKGFRDDLISSVRFHRILRRGREYGPGLSPPDAMHPAPANEEERGLHFVCLNANISRQFEFLQNAWIMNTKFSGMTRESDPVLGNRESIPGCPVTGDFVAPDAEGLGNRVSGLPQFVTVRGGAYFFLPSLRALRYFIGASLTSFAMLAAPVIGLGQTSAPPPPQIILRDPATSMARLAQVKTFPSVIVLPVMSAIDSLRWTRLDIVQRDSMTTAAPAGTVVDQRPRAGTAVSSVRAETLYVAAPRKPNRRGLTLSEVAAAIAKAAATTRPPPSRSGDDVGTGTPAPTPVPTDGGDDVGTGTVVQDTTRVPNLRESTRAMVAAALKRSRLTPGSVRSGYSDEIPKGRVFQQEPVASKVVRTGTPVAVWYSTGPNPSLATLRVPDVVGLTVIQAADSLKRSGFQPGRIDYLTRPGSDGKVVHQVPQAGQPAHRNDAIELTVTIPPARVSVPNVTGLTRRAAQQTLESVGLGVGRITLVVLSGQDTVIVSQIPAPPASADSGTLVNLVENRPPERRRVVVPDLTGRSIADATSILKRDSLVLGDVLRPAVNEVDRVIDQQPRPRQFVFIHSPVTIALGSNSPSPPVPLTRIPSVVGFRLDSARRVLADSGFTHLTIGGRGDVITSSSIVESQAPTAGDFAASNTLISLTAGTRLDPLPVPNLVGMRPEEARTAAEIDGLRMTVTGSVRRIRLHAEVDSQAPAAQSPRPPDSEVDVTVGIPLMPPIAAAILGLLVVTGAGVGLAKVWPNGKGGVDPLPVPAVHLDPVIGKSEAPVLHADGRESIIKSDFTLRFWEEAERVELEEIPSGSIVKPEKPTNV